MAGRTAGASVAVLSVTRVLGALLALLAACPPAAPAAELRLLPGGVALTGSTRLQRVLVMRAEGDRCVADVTERAELLSSDPSVIRVRDSGLLEAVGDGEATVTAVLEDERATARVRVALKPEAAVFRNALQPLLTRLGCNSGACHGAAAGRGGLHLSLRGEDPEADYLTLTREAAGRRVNRQAPGDSLLLLKPTLAVPHGGGLRLARPSPGYQTLHDWIASGLPAPAAADPRLVRVEAFPGRAVLKPHDSLQVLARAWYDDGSARDVTDTAKFESSEEAVAAVDPSGRVRVGDPGQAVITVWFGGRLATCRVLCPLPNEVPAEVYAAAGRVNFIDDLVEQKLREMHIPPSPPCTDREFIRRVYLDAAGVLPAPRDVEAFVADPSADKRARLVESLLGRAEFIDYWTHVWSDLLLVSGRKLPQPLIWSYHNFVRQSVADNKPWDRFARDILTARGGDDLHQGAGNYFVIHKGITDLTETTASTFLGVSITCCRCHNHPVDRWTQDQYWAMANLFSRVAVTNGGPKLDLTQAMSTIASGSAPLIKSLPAGDVYHPRRGAAMAPAPLGGPPLALDSPLDRREYFADWLTTPDNPYFAKALVNRVWKHFFGRGLVEPEDDLRETNPPANDELLDALCRDFVAHGFDVKRLIRTIVTSATYGRSSAALPGNAADDRFGSHYLARPLPAEVLLDAYADVTGVPTPFTQVRTGVSGDVVSTGAYPVGTRAVQLPDTQVLSTFLSTFGRAPRAEACSCEHKQDPSLAQVLHLINGPTLNEKLRAPGSRVEAWVKEDVADEEAVSRLFVLALCRPPTAEERAQMLPIMADGPARHVERRQIVEDLFWGVLTKPEFLLNH